jgi:hypothetical protein
VVALLLATQAQATTFPQDLGVAFSRTFPTGHIYTDYAAPVRATFYSGESSTLDGFYYSEQFPDWIEVTPIRVSLNGAPMSFIYEMGEADDVLPDHHSHRWILDDPENPEQPFSIQQGDLLAIDYTILSQVSAASLANLDGWFATLGPTEAEAVTGWDDDSPVIRFLTATEAAALPAGARLESAYPNPFNPSTTLRIENDASRRIRLEVVDISGRRLRQLADRTFAAGSHELIWDGRDDEGRPLPTGLYFARLIGQGEAAQTKKLLLLK